jgi:hypothetical protein
LITTAHGRKVNGLDLIRTIEKKRGLPKIIALHSTEAPIIEDDVKGLGIDLILESPTSAKKLILGLASICDLDETVMLEKYSKIKSTAGEDDDHETMVASYDETGKEIAVQPKLFKLNEDRPIGVQFPLKKEPVPADPAIDAVDLNLDGSAATPPRELVTYEDSEARKDRFDRFIAENDKLEPANFDRERIAQFNKKIRSAPPVPDIQEIERDRKAFVAAMYEKKPKKS